MIKSAMQRIQEYLEEGFAPRDILIRSNGRVAHLRLSRRRQLLMAAFTGTAVVVLAVAAIPSPPQPSFHLREWVGLQGTPHYSDLLSLTETYADWGRHADRLGQDRQFEPFLATLPSMPEGAAAMGVDDRQMTPTANPSRRHATATAGRSVDQAIEAGQLAEKLRMLNQIYTIEQQQHQAALAQIAELNDQIASLKADLESGSTEKTELMGRVEQGERALATMIIQRNTLQATRADMSRSISGLGGGLASLREEQADFVSNLAERARSNMAELEKTVEMTGLKVGKLLRAADDKTTGQGGPFIRAPAAGQGKSEQKLMASVASLDDEVGRWEKLQVVLHSLPLTAPVDHYYISSTFGARVDPLNGEKAIHEGIDMVGTLRSDVLATAPGKVIFAGRQSGYGRLVEIDHGFGVHTVYAHLDSIQVEKGQTVDYRDIIGHLGNTGRSSGPHVHYEVRYNDRPIDPMGFLKAGRYVFKG